MTDTIRAELEALLAAVGRARIALMTQPTAAPTPPTDGEAGPSEEEWDALVERVWDAHQTIGHQGERFMWDSHFDRAAVMLRDELARWGRLATPTPPVDQKTRELVAAIQAAYSAYRWVSEDQFNQLFDEVVRLADVIKEGCDCSVQGPLDWQREIEKLKSQANPPSANEEWEELAAWLDEEAKRCAAQFYDRITRAVAMLREARLQSVPVADRPWERPGWCDTKGRCWLLADGDHHLQWRLCSVEDYQFTSFASGMIQVQLYNRFGTMVDRFYASQSLPHWAIPIPQPPQANTTHPTPTENDGTD